MTLKECKKNWPWATIDVCPACEEKFTDDSDIVRDDNMVLVHRECAINTTD